MVSVNKQVVLGASRRRKGNRRRITTQRDLPWCPSLPDSSRRRSHCPLELGQDPHLLCLLFPRIKHFENVNSILKHTDNGCEPECVQRLRFVAITYPVPRQVRAIVMDCAALAWDDQVCKSQPPSFLKSDIGTFNLTQEDISLKSPTVTVMALPYDILIELFSWLYCRTDVSRLMRTCKALHAGGVRILLEQSIYLHEGNIDSLCLFLQTDMSRCKHLRNITLEDVPEELRIRMDFMRAMVVISWGYVTRVLPMTCNSRTLEA